MFALTGRRSAVLAGLVCTVLAAGVLWAVRSGASAGGGSPRVARAARSAALTPPTPPVPPGGSRRAAVSPAASATNAHCGQVLTASLTLNGDLLCTSGTALTITANSVVLNLAGHQVGGVGSATDGILIRGTSDTVENGVVSYFTDMGVAIRGIDATPTNDTVSAVRAVGNVYGILDQGANSKVTSSTARGNSWGIFNSFGSGSGDVYSGDHELNNTQAGLTLEGGGTTVVSSNVADGNGFYGIWDVGTGATLTKNTADFNGNDGMFIEGDPTVVDGGGNLAKGNDYSAGTTPEQCNGVVCT